jgi:predicted metal-binding membrane protein
MNMSALEMTRMTVGGVGMDMMMRPAVWDIRDAGLMFVMWWVMMIAMMLPSAAPMVLLFAAMSRKQRETGNPFVPTSLFASAYLIARAGFSVAAVGLQWGLERLALLSPCWLVQGGSRRHTVAGCGHLPSASAQGGLV